MYVCMTLYCPHRAEAFSGRMKGCRNIIPIIIKGSLIIKISIYFLRDFSFILFRYLHFNCYVENLRISLRKIYEHFPPGINESLFPLNVGRNDIVNYPREQMMERCTAEVIICTPLIKDKRIKEKRKKVFRKRQT